MRKKITQEQFDAALELHKKWLRDSDDGVRMVFKDYDISVITFLSRADLTEANLTRAKLTGADLTEADLTGAKLTGANGAQYTCVGDRPLLIIGPIGSRGDYLQAWITDNGLRLKTGCFVYGTVDQFRANLARDHGDNNHAQEYNAALELCIKHAELWTPTEAAE